MPYVAVLCREMLIMLTRAYLVYVRPLLEVNSVIWSPHYKQDIDLIERVQRRFTKRLPGYSLQ